MTVQAFITSINSKMPNSYTDQDKVDWVNELESSLYSDTIKDFESVFIPLVEDQAQYSFPTGVNILEIEAVYVDGTEYPKRDLRQKNTTGYYKEQGKLVLDPVPSEDDDSYVSGTGEITFATNSITTTGDDFEDFNVGDTVLVSGATTAANNKYAVITAVADKVLTFPASTFTAGADAAAVTICLPSLEVVCRVKPTAKTVAGVASETLLLPDAFIDMYRYYCFMQICDLRKQFTEGNNWRVRFNSRMSDFKIYYENNRPKQHIPYKKNKGWG